LAQKLRSDGRVSHGKPDKDCPVQRLDASGCQTSNELGIIVPPRTRSNAVKSTDLRPGMAVKIDGNLSVITQFTHVTPGNLRAFVNIKIKNVVNGSIIEKRLRSGEDVEVVDLDRRPMEYLYSDSSGHVFMDQESYEQISLPDSLVGEYMGYVKPNTVITVLIAENKPVAFELPNVVELKVTDTPPGIKGATATNQLKEATLETGLKTRVPPFIGIGEMVRINTTDGSYNSRA
jgi:elongation factor P